MLSDIVRILIILGLDVLDEYGIHDKLGEPTSIDDSAKQDTAGQQPSGVSANGFYGSRPAQTTQPQPLPSRPNQNGTNSSQPNLYPIEALSPYAHKWTIRARVTNKTQIKSWHNKNGEGRLFSVNLLDESGEIRATAFSSSNEQFENLWELLQEGGVYYISSPCQVKIAKKQFSQLNNDYELTFERDTRVEKAEDQDSVPQIKYNFTSIGDLGSVEKDTTIDTIGILKEVGELSQITSKTTSKPYDKRDLTLVDLSLHSVRLTIWGAQATNFDAPIETVIAFKGVKVSDFGGRSLSLLSSGSMTVSPDIDEAHRLKGWYDAQGRDDEFATHAGLASGSTTARKESYKTISEVKDENLGMNPDQADFFSIKATISYIKQENLSYPACQNADCNKKVVETDPGQWRCERCDKTWDKPQHRYIMALNVSDHTGQLWLSVFDNEGRMIMGKSADEVQELKDNDDKNAIDALFLDAAYKSFVFRVKAKMDNFRDEQRYIDWLFVFLISQLLMHEAGSVTRSCLLQHLTSSKSARSWQMY